MAFGIPAKMERTINFNSLKSDQIMVMSLEVINNLGWHIESFDTNTICAYTKFSYYSIKEKFTLSISDGSITISSRCTYLQAYDFGKNERNINIFVKEFARLNEDISLIELNRLIFKYSHSYMVKFEENEDYLQYTIKSPKVSLSIIGISSLVFIIMAFFGISIIEPNVESLIGWGANFSTKTLNNEYWRLVTSNFIHIGLFHLLVNMAALYFIGKVLESLISKVQFITVFLSSGVLGNLICMYWGHNVINIGSSASIFGLLGLFFGFYTSKHISYKIKRAFEISMVIFVSYNIIFGMQEGISNVANVGGFFGGVLCSYILHISLSTPKSFVLRCLTLLIIAASTLSFSYYTIVCKPKDINVFESNLSKVYKLESEALKVFEGLESKSSKDLMNEIDSIGINNWNESLEILKKNNTLHLPVKAKNKNSLLIKYCNLRLKYYKLMYETVKYNTKENKKKLSQYKSEINEVLDLLKRV